MVLIVLWLLEVILWLLIPFCRLSNGKTSYLRGFHWKGVLVKLSNLLMICAQPMVLELPRVSLFLCRPTQVTGTPQPSRKTYLSSEDLHRAAYKASTDVGLESQSARIRIQSCVTLQRPRNSSQERAIGTDQGLWG